MRRRLLVLGLSVIMAFGLAVGGGAAYGYFKSSGAGTGSATTGSMQTVTLVAITTDTPNSSLLPGTTGEVVVKVHNPNGSQVHLVSVVASGAITVTGGSGCTLANSGVTFSDQTALSIAIPGGATVLERFPGAAAMSLSSASGCQGATFNIPVTITVHSP